MIRIICLTASMSLALWLPSLAQKKIADTPVNNKETLVYMGISAADSSFSVCARDASALYYYAFSKEGELLSTYFTGTSVNSNTPAGAISLPDRYVYFTVNPAKDAFRVATVKRTGGGLRSPELVLTTNPKEKLIASIGDFNKMYAVLYNKKTNTLVVVDALDEYTLNRTEFSLPANYKLPLTGKEFHPMRSRDFHSLEETYHKKKIYVQEPGHLILSFEDDPSPAVYGKTELISLDLTSGEVLLKTFRETALLPSNSSNSFIRHNSLYKITLTNDFLSLQVFDVNSGQLLHQYRYTSEDEISIKRGSMVREGPAQNLWESDADSWASTKKILRKLATGTPAIAVNISPDGQACMQLGTYKEINNGGGFSGGSPMPGGTINTPHGAIPLPASSTPGFYMHGRKIVSVLYFEAFLNLPDLRIASQPRLKNPLQTIDQYMERTVPDEKTADGYYILPEVSGSNLLLYVHKKDKKIEMHRTGMLRNASAELNANKQGID